MTEELPPRLTPAAHQANRLSALPDIYKTTHERLAVELAMKMEDPADVFKRYGMSVDDGLALLETQAFSITLDRIAKEISASGLTFRVKARAQAEALLAHSYEIATDPEAPASVRADIIQWTAKMGDLEPRKDDKEGKVGGGFSLSITFAGQEPMKIVQQEALTLTQEG